MYILLKLKKLKKTKTILCGVYKFTFSVLLCYCLRPEVQHPKLSSGCQGWRLGYSAPLCRCSPAEAHRSGTTDAQWCSSCKPDMEPIVSIILSVCCTPTVYWWYLMIKLVAHTNEATHCWLKGLTVSVLVWMLTYPDPLPPTIATFFPAGTSKDTPFKTFWPSRYSKYTSSKRMVASCGAMVNGGARSLSYSKPSEGLRQRRNKNREGYRTPTGREGLAWCNATPTPCTEG